MELIAVAVFEQWQQEVGHRMLAQIGGDVADAEFALGIAIVGVGNDPAPQGSFAILRPLAVFGKQLLGADLRLVIGEQQQVAVGDGHGGIERDRSAECGHGLLHPAEVFQGQAHGVVRIRWIGHEADGHVQSSDGLVVFALGAQRITQIVVGPAVVGVQFDAAAHHGDDEVRPPGAETDLGEAVNHLDIVRPLRQDLV